MSAMPSPGLEMEGFVAVAVHPVAPLVVEDGGDLARVVAAAALAVEVDRGSVPEGVAGEVDVHVGRELLAEPGIAWQLSPGLRDQVGELEVAGARGVGVAEGRPGRHGAVGAPAHAEVEVPRRRLVDGSAVVAHAHVPALEGARDVAGRAHGQVAAEVGEEAAARRGEVRVRERPARLLDAVRRHPVVGDGLHAALHPADALVLVLVLEREQLARVRVDERLPGAEVARVLRAQYPDETVVVSGVLSARQRFEVARRQRDVREGRLPPVLRGRLLHVALEHRARGVLADRRTAGGAHGAPLVRAEEHQVAVVHDRRQVAVAHRHALEHAGRHDLDEAAAVVDGHVARLLQLACVHAQGGATALDVAAERLPGRLLPTSRVGRPPDAQGVPVRRVAVAGAGEERLNRVQRRPASAAHVEVRGLAGGAEVGEGVRQPLPQRGGLLVDPLDAVRDVEGRMAEFLLRQGRRPVGSHGRNGRSRQDGGSQQGARDADATDLGHGSPSERGRTTGRIRRGGRRESSTRATRRCRFFCPAVLVRSTV